MEPRAWSLPCTGPSRVPTARLPRTPPPDASPLRSPPSPPPYDPLPPVFFACHPRTPFSRSPHPPLFRPVCKRHSLLLLHWTFSAACCSAAGTRQKKYFQHAECVLAIYQSQPFLGLRDIFHPRTSRVIVSRVSLGAEVRAGSPAPIRPPTPISTPPHRAFDGSVWATGPAAPATAAQCRLKPCHEIGCFPCFFLSSSSLLTRQTTEICHFLANFSKLLLAVHVLARSLCWGRNLDGPGGAGDILTLPAIAHESITAVNRPTEGVVTTDLE